MRVLIIFDREKYFFVIKNLTLDKLIHKIGLRLLYSASSVYSFEDDICVEVHKNKLGQSHEFNNMSLNKVLDFYSTLGYNLKYCNTKSFLSYSNLQNMYTYKICPQMLEFVDALDGIFNDE